MSCISRLRGIQYQLAISARPAILTACKGRGGMFLFLCFFTFIHFPQSPLFHLLYYLSSPFLWEKTLNDPQGLTYVVKPQHNHDMICFDFQGTITLPPGIVPGPGAVLMKNEHGQLVIVHQPQLPPGSGAGATSNTPQKVICFGGDTCRFCLHYV